MREATSVKRSSVRQLDGWCIIITIMSVRQYQLQSVNRALQNKIILLKEEVRILTDRYEHRLGEVTEQHERILADKEKTIQYLRGELEKDRELVKYEQSAYDSERYREKADLLKELEKYVKKCGELERKVQGVTQRYQLRRKEMEDENSRLKEEFQINTSRSEIRNQIEKINKIFVSAKKEQGKRQQILDVSDKLSSFIAAYEEETRKNNKESAAYLRQALQNLKVEMLTQMKNIADQDEQYVRQRKSILAKISQIIQFQNKITKESAEENQKLWQLMKKERQNQQTQKIAELEREREERNQKHQLETQQLGSRIKELENERKTILLGFNQLKTLNESRQKSYRQEINALKRSLEQLLYGLQNREAQFQTQVKTLHQQLTHLSERYYQNIEIPLSKISGKLEVEVKNARRQLQKITQNRQFNQLIKHLEGILHKYVEDEGVSHISSEDLARYAEKSQELAVLCRQCLQMEQKRKFQKPSTLEDEALSVQMKLREVEWTQKQNKWNYEVSTLKKQNKRLKDMISQLQSQVKDPKITFTYKKPPVKIQEIRPTPPQVIQLASKVEQLQKQNEMLIQSNKTYQQKFIFEVKVIRQSLKKISGKDMVGDRHEKIARGMQDIKMLNNNIATFLEQENGHIKNMKETITTIDRILVQPIQVFQQFVNRITDGYPSFQHPTFSITKGSTNHSFVPLQKLQAFYDEIAVKRQDNAISTNKLLAELIRTLREGMPAHVKGRHQHQEEKGEEKLERSRFVRDTGLEKKVRDLQGQKIKNREEVLRKLQKVEQTMKTMQSKLSKKMWIAPSRLEDLFDKKLTEIEQLFIAKKEPSTSELTDIAAVTINELKIKLKHCMQENEGILKEIQNVEIVKKQGISQ